jgi:AbrB family looped-hinge helix DNA binding protein
VSIVGERGRITIDSAIREELGIRAGDETMQRVEDGRIVIEVVPGRHRRSLVGSQAQAVRPPSRASRQAIHDAPRATPDADRRKS